jgi:hypothetical protein
VPSGQKKPAGHAACCVLAVTDEQKKPATHGVDVGVELPAARQRPAAHAAHDVDAVDAAPPADHAPTGHGFAFCVPVPAGQ